MSFIWAALSLGACFAMTSRDEAAEVVLEVVEAPGGVEIGVLLFVAEGGGVASAGLGAGAGVDADFQSLGVDVVGEGFHVGEFRVGVQDAGGVALAFPGVVDVDVDVAGVFHAGGDELVGGAADVFVGDFVGEEVPAVPAHGRGLSDGLGGELNWRRRRRVKAKAAAMQGRVSGAALGDLIGKLFNGIWRGGETVWKLRTFSG